MKLIVFSVTLLELAMILAVAVLEYLSGYHAGIMHHFYYKKRIYLAAYFSGQALWLHLLPVGASLATVMLVCHRSPTPVTRVPIRYLTVLLALILTSTLPWFRQLNTFAHLLSVLEICLLLESLRLIVLTRHFVKA